MYINDPSLFKVKLPVWYNGGVTSDTVNGSQGLSSLSLNKTPRLGAMSIVCPSDIL